MTAPAQPGREPLLRVRDLRKSFTLHAVGGRTVVALRGVDLDVDPGTHVALAGPSGAGKSTLLKCVHRTYVVDAGTVGYRTATGDQVDLTELDDSSVADLRASEIGYVSQFLRAEPRRGVLDVVARAAQRMGAGREAAATVAGDVLNRLGIGPRLWATYPTLLSGGEKQRVNLAAGIVAAPRLLLLDEPVSALDPANRGAVLSVIADLAGSGTTVLSVFHDLDAIHQLADRVVVLGGGRVVDEGPPGDVLAGVPEGASA
jgi:alpha-D-ribose 1-methylphosphonate 5-triphosphate synthase subunit PhnL